MSRRGGVTCSSLWKQDTGTILQRVALPQSCLSNTGLFLMAEKHSQQALYSQKRQITMGSGILEQTCTSYLSFNIADQNLTPYSGKSFPKRVKCLASSLGSSIKRVIKKLTLFFSTHTHTHTLMMSLPCCQHSEHIDS